MKKATSPCEEENTQKLNITNLRYNLRNSVAWRMSIIVVAVFLSLAVFTMVWLNNIVTNNHRIQMGRAVLARMEAVSLTMDQALSDITLSMEQLMWNYDFVHYMISPNYYSDSSSMSNSRDYRLLYQLHSLQENNPLVRQAIFYSPISGRLFRDSTYSVLDAEGTYEWFILQKKPTDLNVQLLHESSELHTTSMLYNSQGSLFIIMKLDIGNHIGTLVFELDRKALAELLFNSRQNVDIYPYDSYDNQALKGCLDYLTEGKLSREGPYITQENVNQRKSYRSGSMYLYQSENTHWQYVSPVDMNAFRLTWGELLATVLPLIIILIVMNVLLTQYIRRAVYQPINRLMNQLGGKERAEKNEFDYLESAYSSAKEQREHLTYVLSKVSPDVLESLIRGILFGRRNDYDTIQDILAGIDNPISAEGHFVVCVCVLQKPSDRSISLKEWNLYYISFQQIAGSLSNADYRVTAIRVNENTMALAVCFPENSSEVNVKQGVAEIRAQLQEKTAGLPYSFWMENGRIYTRIINLRESFSEAMERVRYQQYVLSSDSSELQPALAKNSEGSQADVGFNRFYCREQCRALVQLASMEEKNQACDEAIQLVDQMYERCQTMEQFLTESSLLLDELVELLIVYPLSEDDHAKLAKYSTDNALHSCSTKEQLRRYVTSRSVEILQMISSYARKNRYKYVNQAKEYIAANYNNSNLSLNDVAEHCSISASYLSELFNEVSGEKFSAYLAKYRVEKARQLQSATNLTVKEIGYQCGFNSSQNFIRVYKKYTGVTPGQYKGD